MLTSPALLVNCFITKKRCIKKEERAIEEALKNVCCRIKEE